MQPSIVSPQSIPQFNLEAALVIPTQSKQLNYSMFMIDHHYQSALSQVPLCHHQFNQIRFENIPNKF